MGEHGPAAAGRDRLGDEFGPLQPDRWLLRSRGQRLEGGVRPASRSARFPRESHLLIPRFPRGAASSGSQPPSAGTGAWSRAACLAGMAACRRGASREDCNPWPNCLGKAVGAAALEARASCAPAEAEAHTNIRPQPGSQAGTLLMGRTRLFHSQADKGHFFPFLPPGFALRVSKLYFPLSSHSSDFPTPLLSLCLPVLTRFQTPEGSSLALPAWGQ